MYSVCILSSYAVKHFGESLIGTIAIRPANARHDPSPSATKHKRGNIRSRHGDDIRGRAAVESLAVPPSPSVAPRYSAIHPGRRGGCCGGGQGELRPNGPARSLGPRQIGAPRRAVFWPGHLVVIGDDGRRFSVANQRPIKEGSGDGSTRSLHRACPVRNVHDLADVGLVQLAGTSRSLSGSPAVSGWL
jgi:hypothetical protein